MKSRVQEDLHPGRQKSRPKQQHPDSKLAQARSKILVYIVVHDKPGKVHIRRGKWRSMIQYDLMKGERGQWQHKHNGLPYGRIFPLGTWDPTAPEACHAERVLAVGINKDPLPEEGLVMTVDEARKYNLFNE